MIADILNGKRWRCDCSDALTFLRGLPDGIARTCVTSPPYFGLRDYGTAKWEGGDAGCDHKVPPSQGATGQRASRSNITEQGGVYRDNCGKCGARRIDSQIGLEPTPTEFVSKLVDVFREVRRVLTKDGTCWVNMGDSYAGSWGNYGGQNRSAGMQRAVVSGSRVPNESWDERTKFRPQAASGYLELGVKPKDLIGIPWLLAFALRADGWYLRQDIIWHKPNPMPESIRDRCTKAHEYIFLLAKSPRYYFDADSFQEPATYAGDDRGGSTNRYEQNAAGMDNKQYDTRNKRSVWTVCPASFKGAHFATFPAELITPCILAGSAADDIVLEPFSGSGTTLATAVSLGRRALGCELNPKYMTLIERRMSSVTPALPVSHDLDPRTTSLHPRTVRADLLGS